jgi:AcrR family transcriptional regulator
MDCSMATDLGAGAVSAPISRRERLRAATLEEIKQAARQHLVADGPAAISLRAVARDLGLTAAALYRYFPSLDALVEELCADLYLELSEAIVTARDAAGRAAPDEPTAPLVAACREFRRWSVAHPTEFALMFGSPLPGVAEFDMNCAVHRAGLTFSSAFLDAFVVLWRSRPPAPALDPAAEARLIESAGPLLAAGTELPPAALHTYLSGWTRLYGIVAMEVFGHLRWAVSDVEPLFEVEIAEYLAGLGAPIG